MKLKTIEQERPMALAEREQLKIVIVGHVDHGKSTLVGRLFHDTDSLPEGKYESIKKMCEKRGMPFEWSFLMDSLQAERDQGITIDTTQIWFKTPKRDYVIIDAPGHKEFLKNMVSGAASSDAALLIIDAAEGVKEQSKRHGYLLHLLGVSQIAVAVNKMDMINYSESEFKKIEKEYRAYLKGIGVEPTYVIPISAREGDNIVENSKNMKWYKGPSVVQALDHFKVSTTSYDLPLRLPVQDIYKFDERRLIVGRIESGKLSVGDDLIFSPSNKIAKISSIERWNSKDKSETAYAGQSVAITLNEQIFLERGQVASHAQNAPALTNLFRARIFWLGKSALVPGKKYLLKINTSEYQVEVKEIEQVVNTDNLKHNKSTKLERNSVGEVIFRIKGIAALDEFGINHKTGRFVLVEDYHIVGGGIIDLRGFQNLRPDVKFKSENLFPVEGKITPLQRSIANGHKGGVIWLTGLSGSGKTTLAVELQQRLFTKGCQAFVLDGDNVRRGLNSDLGFKPEDRSENIRRVAEVAGLFAEAGVIVITAFISPYRSDRNMARAKAPNAFHSVYVKADLKTCEKRDPKGLYKKARSGEIKDFTGISAPFEEPENADLVIDTTKKSVEECVAMLVDYVETNLIKPVQDFGSKQSDFVGSSI